ncbi:(2Fe-2S)-binding protein [Sphingomonas sp.]|uniref:(2Fe-2S)-binding protein n=1 Tax=Sphingomonas sp. TaxID=28214 RepID=UPI0035C8267F
MPISLKINGTRRTVEVEPEMPLLWVLRDELDLKGSKFGCGVGICGACTVHVDGQAQRSCIVPVGETANKSVTTIEGVGKTALGAKVQAAWLAEDVVQCGYCQAGQIMSACALLSQKPRPTDADIDEGMAGNLCRCCTYVRIRAAIKRAAGVPGTDSRPVA